MTRSRRNTQTAMIQATLEASEYIEAREEITITVTEIDPGLICPACGQVHNEKDYASLPAECQILMAPFNDVDFKNLPTTPEPEPEPEEVKPEPEEVPYPV